MFAGKLVVAASPTIPGINAVVLAVALPPYIAALANDSGRGCRRSCCGLRSYSCIFAYPVTKGGQGKMDEIGEGTMTAPPANGVRTNMEQNRENEELNMLG